MPFVQVYLITHEYEILDLFRQYISKVENQLEKLRF